MASNDLEKTKKKKSQNMLAFERVKLKFQDQITDGRWSVDSRTPPEEWLAKKFSVSRGTVRKALKALEKEGYLKAIRGSGRIVTSNGLTKIKTNTIGIILTSVDEETMLRVMEIQSVIKKRGYSLMIYSLQDKTVEHFVSNDLGKISAGTIDGLIVFTLQVLDSDVSEFNKYLPTVAMHHNSFGSGVPCFYLAWHWIAYTISKYMFDENILTQRLVLPTNPVFNKINSEMIEGFEFSHMERGLDFDLNKVFYVSPDEGSPSDYQKSLQPALEDIQQGSQMGFLHYYNWSAISMARYCLDKGIKIPEEASIITIGDTKFLHENEPIPITTFKRDQTNLTIQAAHRLIDIIEAKAIGDKNLYNKFFGELIIKDSSPKTKSPQENTSAETT